MTLDEARIILTRYVRTEFQGKAWKLDNTSTIDDRRATWWEDSDCVNQMSGPAGTPNTNIIAAGHVNDEWGVLYMCVGDKTVFKNRDDVIQLIACGTPHR